jgi:hypothetical protein
MEDRLSAQAWKVVVSRDYFEGVDSASDSLAWNLESAR